MHLLEEVAVTLGAARDAARRSGRGFVNRMLQRGWLVHSHTVSERDLRRELHERGWLRD